jgi:hypothetical protein
VHAPQAQQPYWICVPGDVRGDPLADRCGEVDTLLPWKFSLWPHARGTRHWRRPLLPFEVEEVGRSIDEANGLGGQRICRPSSSAA